ncbi:AIPR family protein [Vibrio crassostreae]|uniref:AIPR family protein n=1 Tax=Vibrio crassostreae TaxID=246167 RepID=UPI000F50A6B6|nr:AIPR family protein [Vibrio crassostreae]RPF16840.1 AIPR protein [Vibrio crassostreae]TCN89712.1 AIPR protein [Vibrio crassostreae]
MKNEDFYKVLDEELTLISNEFTGDLARQLKEDHQKKSYAFMIWFLNFYSNIELNEISEFITDGNGDNSCDIILDKVNSQGDKIFYLVQSKWNQKNKCNGHFESEVLKSFLSDAQSIIRGDKEKTTNEKFNQRYEKLLEHVKQNGEVKVVYLSLKNNCKSSDSNILSFESAMGANVKVDSFDINRLKLDYIDRNFKKNSPPNPLEKIYSPEYEKIKLDIIQLNSNNSHKIQVDTPFPSLVFNISPKTIFNLVDRYGVSLFNKNVRNPLRQSSINSEIANTLKNDPSYFWYYNNGITAITRKMPQVSNQAESFEILGLQIINGAQTAYSIYLAYLNSSPEEREIIDSEAQITFRLLKSGGKEFDLKVTKFTNSQNPVSDRDFWSSDPIQTNIQNYFYGTNYWYERRSGEFRECPEGTVRIPNSYVASSYLAFWLLDPTSVFDSAIRREQSDTDLIFTSHKDHEDGLYEKIFNKHTSPEEMYAAFCILDTITDEESFSIDRIFFSNGFHMIAIANVILRSCIKDKFGDNANIAKAIIKSYDKDEKKLLRKALVLSSRIMKNELDMLTKKDSDTEDIGTLNLSEDEHEPVFDLLVKKSHFDMLIDKVKKMKVSYKEVDELELKEISINDENNSGSEIVDAIH